MMRPISFLAIAAFVGVTALQQRPSGDDILARVERSVEGITDYVATLEATVDMERLRVPRMTATMYFKKPNRVHFEAPGFAMLPREGIAIDPAWLRQHYDATWVGTDTLDGRVAEKLQLAARESGTRLRQLFLWVDRSNWTIIRMETIPYQGRQLRADILYGLREGRFWLPETLRAEFSLASADTGGLAGIFAPYTHQMNELQRPPRSGRVTVVYTNYRINVGIPDAVFERKDAEQ